MNYIRMKPPRHQRPVRSVPREINASWINPHGINVSRIKPPGINVPGTKPLQIKIAWESNKQGKQIFYRFLRFASASMMHMFRVRRISTSAWNPTKAISIQNTARCAIMSPGFDSLIFAPRKIVITDWHIKWYKNKPHSWYSCIWMNEWRNEWMNEWMNECQMNKTN